ncbi:hypothetical protein BVC80_9007g35 [Macleaya cordata]|uniref:Uncharacterized protein n=1 Tax=Macleaya cordata TaxID=56857 RepID=A0A200QLM4_MACCD|nr:hypothetical protein BVC80_9007g35 [Macleaya cordata]
MDRDLPKTQFFYQSMDIKPLTSEQIALNEKKMSITLDDIIKMSKRTTSKPRKPRASNKSQKFPYSGPAQKNSSNVKRFMVSRSSFRQGVLGQRRSNFENNQFHSVTAIARYSAPAPIRSRHLIRNRMVHLSKPRVGGTSPVQKKTTEESFSHKKQQQEVKVATKQSLPPTFDSSSAYMNEQRLIGLLAGLQLGHVGSDPFRKVGSPDPCNFGYGQFKRWILNCTARSPVLTMSRSGEEQCSNDVSEQ